MHIVADENIPFLDAFFASLPEVGSIERVPGRALSRSHLAHADALLVRSVTCVNEKLLAGTPVRFVGTATIGTDHVDLPWLASANIPFAAAPGCNADAVGDYVLSTLARVAHAEKRTLTGLKVGIVGAGSVGGRLWRRLSALGLDVAVNDPPLQVAGKTGYRPLEEVLAQDVICLHTPLTESGPHPTYHLIDADRIGALHAGQTLINAGRGAVVDNAALTRRLTEKDAPRVVLDVWENEPAIHQALVDQVWQGTPHIAGYSLEGKARGTAMLYDAFCRYFDLKATTSIEQVLPAPQPRCLTVTMPEEAGLCQAMMASYDPVGDHQRFLASQQGLPQQRATAFDRLRKDYPVRREFASREVVGVRDAGTRRLLEAAGFQVGSIQP